MVIFLIILLLLISGCATLPEEFQGIYLEKKTGFSEVLESPEKYKDINVLWGGKIVKCLNKEDVTFLEIIQFPLDLEGKPKIDSISEGRFQVETPKFLDCAIYSPGRLITIFGSFKGLKEGKIGEKFYNFPFIEGKIFHLWREELRVHVEIPSPPCYWHPWWEPWWYHPWCCP